jgi:hypothetical protein
MYAPARVSAPAREFFSDFPAYNRAGFSDRAALLVHSPHTGLGGTPAGTVAPTGGTPPPATESHTVLYVGIGLGVLAVGGLAIYLATKKKGRRR